MRKLTIGVATLAVSAFAFGPAMACEWNKTAQSKSKMTLAEASTYLEDETFESIATNDLTAETTGEGPLHPLIKPEEKE